MIAPFFFIHVFICRLQYRCHALDSFGHPVMSNGDIQFLDRDLSAYLTTGLMEIRLFYMLPDDDEFIAADAENFTATAIFQEN